MTRGLALALLALAACNTAAPATVVDVLEGASFSPERIDIDYAFGSSPCPTIAPVDLVVSADETNVDSIYLSVSDDRDEIDVTNLVGTAIPPDARLRIAPGSRFEISVEFNCASPSSVSGAITLEIRTSETGPVVDSATVPVSVRVSGAP